IPAGASLFIASDIAVARNTFVAPGYANKLWGLPLYYGGQLLLAWAAGAVG
ncbi:MAG: lysoplasmalogenase, partial [Acidimicrobiia bacterium]|nr:lysoplasmalogenase [Acidimicrobiia bacterium]